MIWSGTEGNVSMLPLTETELMSPSDAKIKNILRPFSGSGLLSGHSCMGAGKSFNWCMNVQFM